MAIQNSTGSAILAGALTSVGVWIEGITIPEHPIPADIATACTVILLCLIVHFVPDKQPPVL